MNENGILLEHHCLETLVASILCNMYLSCYSWHSATSTTNWLSKIGRGSQNLCVCLTVCVCAHMLMHVFGLPSRWCAHAYFVISIEIPMQNGFFENIDCFVRLLQHFDMFCITCWHVDFILIKKFINISICGVLLEDFFLLTGIAHFLWNGCQKKEILQ